MALFGKKDPAPAPAAPTLASSGGVSFAKGAVTLEKAGKVMLTKGTGVKATCSWSSETDYDLYGFIITKDGGQHPVATFAAGSKQPVCVLWSEGGTVVQHMGDIGRGVGGKAQETIEITLGDNAVAFVPVAYSAQSNGSGSFHRYKVTTEITNGSDTVTIPADQASKNDGIYTLVPGIIYNRPDGVEVQRLELYSRGGELRPDCVLQKDGTVKIEMDRGPRNDYK